MPIRVYLVEDHPAFQRTLSDYLDVCDDLVVCGVASSAEQAIAELEQAEPDVVVLDLSLPSSSGFELLEHIRKEYDVPCLILSGHGDGRYVDRALASGARGYVLKGHPQEIPVGIRAVVKGNRFVSAALVHIEGGGSESAGV